MRPLRPLPSRVASALICLWATLLSIQLPIAGCAPNLRPLAVADPSAQRALGLAAVADGSPLRVWLRDGKVVQGAYQGIGRLAAADYAAHYEAWRARHPEAGWPALGDSVRIVTVYGGTRVGVFEGFDWGAVRMRSGADAELVRFEDMRTLTGSSEAVFTADSLARLRESRILPLSGTLRLALSSGRLAASPREIPLDQVESLQVRSESGDWVGGVLLATALGVVVVYATIGAAFSNSMDCGMY